MVFLNSIFLNARNNCITEDVKSTMVFHRKMSDVVIIYHRYTAAMKKDRICWVLQYVNTLIQIQRLLFTM